MGFLMKSLLLFLCTFLIHCNAESTVEYADNLLESPAEPTVKTIPKSPEEPAVETNTESPPDPIVDKKVDEPEETTAESNIVSVAVPLEEPSTKTELQPKSKKEVEPDLETADSYRHEYRYRTQLYNRSAQYTPYDVTPGLYNPGASGGHLVGYDRPYNPQSIYYSYLSSPAYHTFNRHCKSSYTGRLHISERVLRAAFGYAIYELNKYRQAEHAGYRSGNYLRAPYTSAAARSQSPAYINRRNPLYQRELQALFMEHVTKYLQKYACLTPLQVTLQLPDVKVDAHKTGYVDRTCRYAYGQTEPYEESCRKHATNKWRPIDGTCNNLKHKYWGRSDVCHLRLLPSAYLDGVSKPRTKGLHGHDLPPPRVVSNTVHHSLNSRAYYTTMKMQWGQWVNHDITNTPQVQASYTGMIECCRSHATRYAHPECLPILLARNDPYQSKYRKTCMNFVRSSPCPLCVAGPRQQRNTDTSYLDASSVYGNTIEDAKRLRTFSKGTLKYSLDSLGYQILPVTYNPWAQQCKSSHGRGKLAGQNLCFDAGDNRNNQQPAVGALHIIWLRQHNRLANKLWKYFPTWTDEQIYQTARWIVVAQQQHITYKEYLPIVLGPDQMNYYDLTDKPGYTHYNPYTDPTTWNEYATAACRYGHSQVPNTFSLISKHAGHYNASVYWLKDHYFDPYFAHAGKTDDMIRGLVKDHSMTLDPWVEDSVRQYLYRDGKESGLDLAATNINRGRDHGLPGYPYYLEYCFNYKVYGWKDLEKFIPPKELYYLRNLYRNPHDIDLFTGGMSERKVVDGDVGPTFACINGIQWHHIKFGDRWWYTHGYQVGSFSNEQLTNIKTTTLASILCHNTYIDKLQPYVMLPESGYNRPIDCKTYPDIDVSKFHLKP